MKEILILPEEPKIVPPSFVLVVKYPCGTKVHANILPPARPAKEGHKEANEYKNKDGVFLSSAIFKSNIASSLPRRIW